MSHLFTTAIMGAAAFWVFSNPATAQDNAPTGNAVVFKRTEYASDSAGRYLFAQNGVNLRPDILYTLSFWAKSPQSIRLRISTKFDRAPWTGFGKQTFLELAPDWQHYDIRIDSTGAEPEHTRLQFHFVEQDHGEIWIADIQLQEEGTDPNSENLLLNSRFEDAITNWYTEGVKNGVFEVSVVPVDN